ncbi:MAG: hypothetical protein SGILL_000369 [Bacillariaceae sp.]
MRKAGGTTLRSYLRGVATTLGITFDVSEGGHFETPGNGGDPNTLYVTHLRDPFRRSISHFQYEVRWPCAQMVQNTSFSPSLENAANLTAWILERDYQHPSLDERTFTKQHRCDDTQKYLIDCATNCYIRWMNYPKGACDDQVFDRKSVYYYKALQSLRSYDVIVDTDRLFVNNNDGDGDATGAANNPYAASLERCESTRQLFFERNQADYDLYHDLVTCTVAASNQVLFPVGSSNLTLEDFTASSALPQYSQEMIEAVEKTAFTLALSDHRVSAQVVDLDYYRIRGGMAVDTDYIIRVEPKEGSTGPSFETFTLSKTFSAFRSLASQLKKISDRVMSSGKEVDSSTKKLAQYCETVNHLVETQRTQYFGKVNYNYVQVLAKKRSQLVQEVLDATLNHFPKSVEGKPFSGQVAKAVELFLLCDHCVEVDGETSSKAFGLEGGGRHYSKSLDDDDDTVSKSSAKSNSKGIVSPIEDAVKSVGKFIKHSLDETPMKAKSKSIPETSTSTPVVPITRKTRKSLVMRQLDDDELKQVGEEANLLLDDERPHAELLVPSYSSPVPSFSSKGSKLGLLVENNPIVFALIAVAVLVVLRRAAELSVTVDIDVLLLFMWACFCFGLHCPRPMISGVDKHYGPPPATPTDKKKVTRQQEDRDGRKLLRMSMVSTPEARKSVRELSFADEMEDDIMEVMQSPLPRFPEGAELGTKNNCWSEPVCTNFHVRGGNYLRDKVKIESADFLFPVRALDLFLTDTCPENVGA